MPPVATRFAVGRSGNPSGRPKGSRTSFERILEQELERLVDGDPRFDDSLRITRRRRLVRALLDLAELGDPRAARLLLDRVWRPGTEGAIEVVLLFDAQDADA